MKKIIWPTLKELEEAKLNRERIAKGRDPNLSDTAYWNWLDSVLKTLPKGSLLPEWIPIGEVPEVTRFKGRGYTPERKEE